MPFLYLSSHATPCTEIIVGRDIVSKVRRLDWKPLEALAGILIVVVAFFLHESLVS